MRLLIYLLALMSGFSAAEAARAEISPASSVAQTAVAAAEALASQEPSSSDRPADGWVRITTYAPPFVRIFAGFANTPVTRYDLLHN
jgi:hypothetical protein